MSQSVVGIDLDGPSTTQFVMLLLFSFVLSKMNRILSFNCAWILNGQVFLILCLCLESQYPVTLKPYGVPPVIRWPNDEENDTTDLTDVDQETTKEEAFKKFLSTKHQYQSEDIAGTVYKCVNY